MFTAWVKNEEKEKEEAARLMSNETPYEVTMENIQIEACTENLTLFSAMVFRETVDGTTKFATMTCTVYSNGSHKVEILMESDFPT